MDSRGALCLFEERPVGDGAHSTFTSAHRRQWALGFGKRRTAGGLRLPRPMQQQGGARPRRRHGQCFLFSARPLAARAAVWAPKVDPAVDAEVLRLLKQKEQMQLQVQQEGAQETLTKPKSSLKPSRSKFRLGNKTRRRKRKRLEHRGRRPKAQAGHLPPPFRGMRKEKSGKGLASKKRMQRRRKVATLGGDRVARTRISAGGRKRGNGGRKRGNGGGSGNLRKRYFGSEKKRPLSAASDRSGGAKRRQDSSSRVMRKKASRRRWQEEEE